MKMKTMNTVAVVLLSALAGIASAAPGTPKKTGDIGSANGKAASCIVATTRLDLKEMAVRSVFNSGDIVWQPFTDDGRLQAEKTMDLGDNYRLSLSLTLAPAGYGLTKEPILLTKARLFRVESDGHKVVLATGLTTSDDINRGGVPYSAEQLYTFTNMENSELVTIAANQKNPTSVYALLKSGLVSDGALVEVSASCQMNMKK